MKLTPILSVLLWLSIGTLQSTANEARDEESNEVWSHELHKRLEKIKSFSRLHRHGSSVSLEPRDCSLTKFLEITEIPYGQSGNQLIGFTHALWVADKTESTLVIPTYMEDMLRPFKLHGLRSMHCFVDNSVYQHHKSTKGDSIKTVEIESEDSFFLTNILGGGIHAGNYPKGTFPPLDSKLVDEMSLHFLDVFSTLWGHIKPVVMSETLRILRTKVSTNFKYTAVHKRGLDGGCSKIFLGNFDEADAQAISSQIPLESADWKSLHSSALCEMNAGFISDIMKLNHREMAVKSVDSDTSEPVFLAWDGKGSIESYKNSNAQVVLSSEFSQQHDQSELKASGIIKTSDLLKFVDLFIAVNADFFVLNPRSTFSFEIYTIRAILGLQSVPLPPTKDLYMLSVADYKKKSTAGAEGWDGLWVNWASISKARLAAINPLNIIHHGNN